MFEDFEITELDDCSYIISATTVNGEHKEERVAPGPSLAWFLLNRIYRHKNEER